MIIALAGYNGFIGKHIREKLAGNKFIFLDRKTLYGDPKLLSEKISGSDVIINTAGYSITKRWTSANRMKIMQSRINVTRNLVEAINLSDKKPAIFLNASAIGIYRFGAAHNEDSNDFNDGFLANVVRDWEQEAREAEKVTKVVLMRLGLVLGSDGGALPRLLKIFKFGLGGRIGSGKQVYSFIHVSDVADAVAFLIDKQEDGIYNFTAPHPVTNQEFTEVIAKSLKKPHWLPVPPIALKMIMGKAAEIVTKGQTVYPEKLLEKGYKFTFATIEEAIVNLVRRN